MSDMVRTVLIVEDCAESVPALEIALQNCLLCTVEHYERGNDALAVFQSKAESMLAVITDLNLPDMGGWDIIRHIRLHSIGALLPIIAISADTNPRAKLQALNAGADAFFSKPYSPSELCRFLERMIHAKQTRPITSSDSI